MTSYDDAIAETRAALHAAASVDLSDDDCYDGIFALDMRRDTPWPELPEAGYQEDVPYIAGPLVDPDGRRKIICSGRPEVIRAFLETWAPQHGLTDLYGDPARGFAGGYLP